MLYLLNDMVENQVNNAEIELYQLPVEDVNRREFLNNQIAYYKKELMKFREEIEKQLSEKFQFSVEELYAMYGQYERKFLTIEFHKFSSSAQKFGRNISGVLTYYKKEREELENIISNEKVPRTNGLVKIDCTNEEKLTNEQKKN
ncbi:hypothetical protein [Empedobacter brevis]|uniref:hypothetical protein n=1 Tax=Empedobacter brevis TaxID=247 RepID=UPI00132F8A8B|nr:hypothetical protein [Empedobacter brevis]